MLTAWRLTALVPVVVVVISAPAAAQSFYGSLISVTQDAQGGVDPDLRGHYMHNWNFALTKTTPIHGRVNLTLRAEAFQPVQSNPVPMPNTQVTTAAQSNLGRITTQSNQPRLIQLAFRLTY